MDTRIVNTYFQKSGDSNMGCPGTKMMKLTLLLFCLLSALAGISRAEIIIGSYTFENEQYFADAAAYISGGPASLSFPTTGDLDEDLLLAAGPDTGQYCFGAPVTFELNFNDPTRLQDDLIIQNREGADLVLFELGAVDAIEVSVYYNNSWTATQDYLLTDTGDDVDGMNLNAVEINLDDLGVSGMATVELVKINTDSFINGGQTISASVCAVGGINMVPEPATLLLLGLGSLYAARGKRKR